MIQKCSTIKVLEVFLNESTKMHFIREISRKIGLATTSVSNNVKELLNGEFIVKKEGVPFSGYIANRENDRFIFYKKSHNLYSLYDLKSLIAEELNPKSIIVFGSYSKGEDIESSDIDILVVSKVKKEINFNKIENKLNRKVHIIIVKDIKELDKPLRENISNGIVIHGAI